MVCNKLTELTHASKLPGSTIRLSITAWIFVTRLSTAACSAGVGDKSAFLFKRACNRKFDEAQRYGTEEVTKHKIIHKYTQSY